MIPKLIPVPLAQSSLSSPLVKGFDGLVVLFSSLGSLSSSSSSLLAPLASDIQKHSKLDASLGNQPTLIVSQEAPGSRLLLTPLGSLLGDVDDVRRYYEAARKALSKCSTIGISRPLVFIPSPPKASDPRVAKEYKYRLEVALLGLLAESYVPLQARERNPGLAGKIKEIGFVCENGSEYMGKMIESAEWAFAVEQGRLLARDVGGSDPERMAPLRCAQYITHAFQDHPEVKVTVVTDPNEILREYPLMHAVVRASLDVARHRPAVVKLEYHSPDQKSVYENLFFIGKGVTYDTGGADVKAGGIMRGMSRDKCGAAACAGFLKTVALMKPKEVNVVAYLGFVRNSVGPDNYVSDELITSRAGVEVLVGNTDAEGRMVMCDLLAQAKEHALSQEYNSVPSRLFTVATLTGHAIRAMGTGYSISLDNGPAREAGVSKRLFDAGHLIAEPFETSTLRREDYEFIKPSSVTEDVVQANEKPSTMTSRGHQYPAAFLSVASGIAKHGLDSEKPLCYTHVDIAGSAEEGGGGLSLAKATGAPVAAFTAAFLL